MATNYLLHHKNQTFIVASPLFYLASPPLHLSTQGAPVELYDIENWKQTKNKKTNTYLSAFWVTLSPPCVLYCTLSFMKVPPSASSWNLFLQVVHNQISPWIWMGNTHYSPLTLPFSFPVPTAQNFLLQLH